jgi:hypothetical protein
VKLRLEPDPLWGPNVVGPDGKVIREVFASEQARLAGAQMGHSKEYIIDHLEEFLYGEDEVKLRNIWEEGRHAADVGPDNQQNPYQGTENAKYWDDGFKSGSEYRNRTASH